MAMPVLSFVSKDGNRRVDVYGPETNRLIERCYQDLYLVICVQKELKGSEETYRRKIACASKLGNEGDEWNPGARQLALKYLQYGI